MRALQSVVDLGAILAFIILGVLRILPLHRLVPLAPGQLKQIDLCSIPKNLSASEKAMSKKIVNVPVHLSLSEPLGSSACSVRFLRPHVSSLFLEPVANRI
jgi:hypothetical protein